MASSLTPAAECRQALWNAISEKDFQLQVREAAHLLGWLTYATWNSTHSTAGYPDITVVGHGRVFWFECKREDATRSKLSPAQEQWLAALNAAHPGSALCIRPHDLEMVAKLLGGTG